MKTYTVRSGQNIYDIAITLHGSVEGIFDLLISNPDIDNTTIFKSGDVINYHEDYFNNDNILTWLDQHDTSVKNGEHVYDYVDIASVVERHLYSYHPEIFDTLSAMTPDEKSEFWNDYTTPRIIVDQIGKLSSIAVWLKPDSHMFIDWGDYTGIQVFDKDEEDEILEHCYKSTGRHRIVIYGNFQCRMLDLTNIEGMYYALTPIYTDQFVSAINNDNINQLIGQE